MAAYGPSYGVNTSFPASYPDFLRLSELMALDFLLYCGLDYTQSHVVNWVFSLLVFLAITSCTTLLEGQNLNTYVCSAIRRLVAILFFILLLEVVKASLMNFALVHQGDLKPKYEVGFYIFSSPL